MAGEVGLQAGEQVKTLVLRARDGGGARRPSGGFPFRARRLAKELRETLAGVGDEGFSGGIGGGDGEVGVLFDHLAVPVSGFGGAGGGQRRAQHAFRVLLHLQGRFVLGQPVAHVLAEGEEEVELFRESVGGHGASVGGRARIVLGREA